MFRLFHDFIINLSIRVKFFISSIIILILVYAILMTVYSYNLTKTITEQTLFTADKTLYQTKDYIEYKVDFTKNLLNVVAINDTLQELMQTDNSVYTEDIGRWSLDSDTIQKVLFYGKDVPGAKSMKVYFTTGLGTVFENNRYLDLNKYLETKWYKTLIESSNKVQWFTGLDFDDEPDDSSIIAMKKVPSSTNLNEAVGLLRLDYDLSEFSSLLSHADVTEHSSAILFTEDHILGVSDNIDEAHYNDFVDNLILASRETLFETWEQLPYRDEKFQIAVTDIDSTDWRLMLIIPNRDISETIHKSQLNLLYILLGMIPLTVPLAYFFSRSITKRIESLIHRIQDVDRISIDQEVGPSSKDEVGILTRNFNSMLVRISMLLDEKFELGQELNRSELKALQAQINPHFLYNTLDQIYWMGIESKNEDISGIVLELSKFYKLSLSKGKELVTLEDEIKHITAYIKIQNYRFDNAVNLIIDIPSDAMNTRIPKITLQPIIENAILHGILETDEETGEIHITTSISDNCLIIIVKDDGIGLDESTLESLNSQLQNAEDDDPTHGYGLHNIDRRLKLVFGEAYGLKFESITGNGTSVHISIPFKSEY